MRLMGLDFGARTCGVALSDPLCLIAQRRETIVREKENHLRRTFARIEELIVENDVTKIVVGDPLHMDGRISARAETTRAFCEQLARRTGLPVELWDERLTSAEAEALMREAGVHWKEGKEMVDMIAAELILQDYMDHHKNGTQSG